SDVGVCNDILFVDVEYGETSRILSYHDIRFSATFLNKTKARTYGRFDKRFARLNFACRAKANTETVAGHNDETCIFDGTSNVKEVVASRSRVQVEREAALHFSPAVHEVCATVAANGDEVIASPYAMMSRWCEEVVFDVARSPSFKVCALLVVHPNFARLICNQESIVPAVIVIDEAQVLDVLGSNSNREGRNVVAEAIDDVKLTFRRQEVLEFSVLVAGDLKQFTDNRSVQFF